MAAHMSAVHCGRSSLALVTRECRHRVVGGVPFGAALSAWRRARVCTCAG